MKESAGVRRQIDQRISDWEQGNFDALMRDAEHTTLSQITSIRGRVSDDQWVAIYSRLVLKGKLRQAVYYPTELDQGGVLQPEEEDEKTGDLVIKILHGKHPTERNPDGQVL